MDERSMDIANRDVVRTTRVPLGQKALGWCFDNPYKTTWLAFMVYAAEGLIW